ncbi:glycoside hydrolase family 36 protein [Glycomyces algeriensis]|uniref:Alpha-galactosidase n=1 Tax=Glycomyces algeriensis TaxID=256037 RepID=A0A9W6GC70_9ACTN|nr:glycoside hydrolase family 36 protein [Glycomyces algeriensis]MDA1365600.1 alpha-galactosidase [Glycomyces algeriensis]MDR7351288.1 alpha-galactosidase [Glycomyces algeriensis]GLI44003.1 alpha-galactosidase [Glycomyces algeriensis]
MTPTDTRQAETVIEWTEGALHLRFDHGDDHPVRLVHWGSGPEAASVVAPMPIVDVSSAGERRARHDQSLLHWGAGLRLRYTGHHVEGDELLIHQREPESRLEVTSVFRAAGPGLQIRHTVRNSAETDIMLLNVSSALIAVPEGAHDLLWGESEWLAEGRWHQRPLKELLPNVNPEFHHRRNRGNFGVTSHGSFSSGAFLPTGVLALEDGPSIAWQVETSAGWHWEASQHEGTVTVGVYGPTDLYHQFAARLAPGEAFTTVPAGFCIAEGGRDAAFGALTDYRRAIRESRPIDARLPLVYNDFMNTLMAGPSTEKELPLIEAAAAAGAEYYCIDAGWYGTGNWWADSGDWHEVPGLFTGGLVSVIEAIRAKGMRPGIWLEPEAVGERAAAGRDLPDEAFFQRFGRRVSETGHYQLDFRHPAARAHLDEAVDRLVAEFGIEFFKLDYNVNSGVGTDVDAAGPGAGLLGHTIAFRQWLSDAQARHPEVLFENCGSGGMRMDYHLLSVAHLQSTSDQQDFRLYAAIAAAAPASVTPEQAGNWAYPDKSMSLEETAFAMTAGVMGRLYLSGFLGGLGAEQFALVREAIALHKDWRQRIARSHPVWPLGLPGWDDDVLALQLDAGAESLLAVWSRGGAAEVALPTLRGRTLQQVYPVALPEWKIRTVEGATRIEVQAGPAARIYTIR